MAEATQEMIALARSENRKKLSEIGYQVIDAKNEHVEKGWIVRVPNDDERVLIAASEGDAWDAARDHHARMTSEVTQAALEPCPFCGGKAEWKDDPKICGVPFGLVVDHKPDCFLAMPMSEEAMLAAWNTRLTAQSGEGRSGAGEDAVAVGLAEQVAEAMDDDGGSWRSCTGCHETNEGYSTGHFPYSAALKCELGSGCRECGGIGAVWDDTDYADMADFIAAADRDHANIKRILIENDIQPYRAEQIAMAITELEIPAALNARQSGEGERLRDVLVKHFPTGLRGLYEQSAQRIPVLTYVGTNCLCGWCTSATDEHEVREEWAAHVLAALRATDDAGGA